MALRPGSGERAARRHLALPTLTSGSEAEDHAGPTVRTHRAGPTEREKATSNMARNDQCGHRVVMGWDRKRSRTSFAPATRRSSVCGARPTSGPRLVLGFTSRASRGTWPGCPRLHPVPVTVRSQDGQSPQGGHGAGKVKRSIGATVPSQKDASPRQALRSPKPGHVATCAARGSIPFGGKWPSPQDRDMHFSWKRKRSTTGITLGEK